MKITSKSSYILECLQKISSSVVTKAGALPILQNFLLDVKNKSVTFVSTNLELAVKNYAEVSNFNIIEEGSITIPFKKFKEILESFDSNSDVSISVEDGTKINIVSGKTKVKLIGMPASDYPAIPSINEKDSFKTNAYEILYMIEKTSFSASGDDKNTVLNGILWKKDKKDFTMAATDGRRLSVISRELKNAGKKDFRVIIPSDILEEIAKFIKSECNEKDDMIVDISTNQVGFRIKNTDFISRFIEGNFPSYEQIIPKSFESTAKISAKKLLDSTRRATICIGDSKSGFVKYNFKKDVLIISSSSQSVDFEDEIDCSFSGTDFTIVYNPKFIIDFLKIIDDEEVEFKFTGASTPTMIKSARNEDLIYMVMPLKTS